MNEYIWIADYSVRRRKRKLFEKDERWRLRMWGKHFQPQAAYATEVEARRHMVEEAQAALDAERRILARQERALKTARDRLAKAEGNRTR